MKINSIMALVMVIFLIAGPIPVAAYTIDDSTNGPNTYWGGLVGNSQPSSGDVIGNHFEIDGMNVQISGTTMTVQVIGPYFYNAGGPGNDGDLYISSKGWKTANNSPHFPSDIFVADPLDSKFEGWNFVVGVKKVSVNDPGLGRRVIVDVPGVYELLLDNTEPPSDNAFQFTTGGPSSGGRALQAFRGGYGDFVESASIVPDYANSMLTYTFDTSFLADPNNMGFHWTMYCGNDVVEGQATVPEPGTLLLLGGGLIAIGVLRRKFKS